MQAMRFFMDTHDKERKTFPEGLTPAGFEQFFAKYEQACQAEGVIPLRTHVGFEDGRAFCLNLAPDADAVRRVHARVGLAYDSITEVSTATPGDMFFRRQ